jgi:hypothetical protein
MSEKDKEKEETNATWIVMTNQIGKKIPFNMSDLAKMGSTSKPGVEYLRDSRIDLIRCWAISCPKCGNIQLAEAQIEKTRCQICGVTFRVILKKKHIFTRVIGFFLSKNEGEKWLNEAKRQSSLEHIEPASELKKDEQ